METKSFVLKSVTKKYAENNIVLDNVSATFNRGIAYAVTGASGSGKTTLLQCIAGIEPLTSGSIFIGEHSISAMAETERAEFLRRNIGLVFQLPYLIKELSVLENVMLKGIISQRSVAECKDEADSLLESVGLADKAQARPVELSGGQQQRVALARALFGKPLFLLADEPTGNLDDKTGHIIVELLLKFQERYGMGLIVSSHNAYVIGAMHMRYEVVAGSLQLAPVLSMHHEKSVARAI